MTPHSHPISSFRYSPAITPFHGATQRFDHPIGYFRQVAYWARLGFLITFILNIVLSFLLLLSALSPKVHLLTAEMLETGFVPIAGRLVHQTYSNAAFQKIRSHFLVPSSSRQSIYRQRGMPHEK